MGLVTPRCKIDIHNAIDDPIPTPFVFAVTVKYFKMNTKDTSYPKVKKSRLDG